MTAKSASTGPLVIRFSFTSPGVWSINERIHWAERARRTADWRQISRLELLNGLRRIGNPPPGHWSVAVELPFTTNRRRDPHNFVGTCVKAIVDGITDTGLVEDDTAEWITVEEPTLTVGQEVVVTLTERKPEQ